MNNPTPLSHLNPLYLAAALATQLVTNDLVAAQQSQPVTNYTALYVFGSSWSDTQNGLFHWQGHPSNGLMWPEFLSTNIGLAYIRANNFAVVGSPVEVVLSHVANFPSRANPQLGLYHLWAGITDFSSNSDNLSSDPIWRNRIRSWVGSISNAVERLYAKGARSIVVPNVPDKSREPWAVAAFGSNSMNQLLLRQRIAEFNAALTGTLEKVDHARPDLRLYILNMQSKLDDLVTNFVTYGFTKTYPAAVEKMLPGRNWSDCASSSD